MPCSALAEQAEPRGLRRRISDSPFAHNSNLQSQLARTSAGRQFKAGLAIDSGNVQPTGL
eukprot:9425023-Alexandrium_andersonii.AAC.1